MTALGYNYRLSDLNCALGLSQLKRLDWFLQRRRALARRYDQALAACPAVRPLRNRPQVANAYHLYVVRLDLDALAVDRDHIFRKLRSQGIGVNVHYPPVHRHPFYQERFGTRPGLCPQAERAYQEILTLPLYPTLEEAQVDLVADALRQCLRRNLR